MPIDKVVLITGASSGIGAGMARELAASGAKVMLGARRVGRLDALAAELADAGGTALAHPLDVTDRESVAAFATAARAAWGRVDVIVNNAGVMPRMVGFDISGAPICNPDVSPLSVSNYSG